MIHPDLKRVCSTSTTACVDGLDLFGTWLSFKITVKCKSTAEYGKLKFGGFFTKKGTGMVALSSGGEWELDTVEFSIWIRI